MSLEKTRSALMQEYQAAGLGLPTALENRDFDQPAAGSSWASVFFMPAGIEARTLGADGEDEQVGIFQIDVACPQGKGTSELLGHADALRAHFKTGKRFMYDSQEVAVRKTDVSRLRRSDTGGEFVVTVSVYWNARYPR